MFNFFGFQRRQTHTATRGGHSYVELGQMEDEIDRIVEAMDFAEKECDQSKKETALNETRSSQSGQSSPETPDSPQRQCTCQSQTASQLSGVSEPPAEEVASGRAPHRSLPPSYQDVAKNPRLWKVTLEFTTGNSSQARYPFVESTTGWFGHVTIETADIVGLMQEGLFLKQENVKVNESYITPVFIRTQAQWYWDRHFTLVDPKWTGTMVVRTAYSPVTSQFRIEHLTADHVSSANVVDAYRTNHWYYCFTRCAPHVNANYVLEDTMMEGLWPWPRKDMDCEEGPQEEDGKSEDGWGW
ncbi:hypothetical protein ACHAP7_000807 [Fusarium lateritium]